MEWICRSTEETFALGERMAAGLRGGDVVLLSGEMGAGKSVLARGVARGLGVEGPVPSPSFTILNCYAGRVLALYHFDFYRLSGARELFEAGLDEHIPSGDGVCLIEWPEIAPEAIPDGAMRLRIVPEDGARRIFTEDERLAALLPAAEEGEP